MKYSRYYNFMFLLLIVIVINILVSITEPFVGIPTESTDPVEEERELYNVDDEDDEDDVTEFPVKYEYPIGVNQDPKLYCTDYTQTSSYMDGYKAARSDAYNNAGESEKIEANDSVERKKRKGDDDIMTDGVVDDCKVMGYKQGYVHYQDVFNDLTNTVNDIFDPKTVGDLGAL